MKLKVQLVQRPDNNFEILIGQMKIGVLKRRLYKTLDNSYFWIIRSMEPKLHRILYNDLDEARAALVEVLSK